MGERHERQRRATERVTVGFAVRPNGKGTAFAALGGEHVLPILRAPFGLTIRPALQGRDVAYAAVTSVATALLDRGVRSVALCVPDERLVADLRERRAVPVPLTVPYVTLRCLLNRFADVRVERAAPRLARDLANRARAEVSLDIAA